MLLTCELRGAYKWYNKKYFGNKLPYIPIRIRKLSGQIMGKARFGYPSYTPVEILLAKNGMRYDKNVILTLLHEMIHISIGGKYQHGPKFRKERKRLLRAGAYNDLL